MVNAVIIELIYEQEHYSPAKLVLLKFQNVHQIPLQDLGYICNLRSSDLNPAHYHNMQDLEKLEATLDFSWNNVNRGDSQGVLGLADTSSWVRGVLCEFRVELGSSIGLNLFYINTWLKYWSKFY